VKLLKYCTFLAVILFLAAGSVAGQEKNEGVYVHADPRVNLLLESSKVKKTGEKKTGQEKSSATILPAAGSKAVKGFRVQIHCSGNRFAANKTREDFNKNYGYLRIHSYISYFEPDYRVRVGDFKNRKDAERVVREIWSSYPGCVVVADKITTK
jgi:SPOR domain